ncbi:MAG: hypothetical protein QOJ32_2746, partial [Frankiaceae bacterium]|nr:hypothetical protein [Frankiaceae bacterium]
MTQHSLDRPFDVVLFGASGFTGRLTAQYLAAHAPADLRWAIAGRNRGKLEKLRDELAAENATIGELEILTADVGDRPSVRRVAEAAKVVVTTVGPYLEYGEPLVAACAESGADYLDLTGEPEFVDRMYVENDAAAKASGARLVHCCGFDSVPHDLGAYFTLLQLPENVPVRIDGYVRSNASFSGGTYHSAINGFA